MSEDITAIEQLQWTYCHRVDRGSAAEVASLFAPDGVLQPAYDGDYELVGRAEIERWYAFYHEHFRSTVRHLKHLICSPLIEIDGERAKGCSYLLATAVANDDSGGFCTSGTYHDAFVRHEDGWLFQTRRIEVEWVAPLTSVVERLAPLNFPVSG